MGQVQHAQSWRRARALGVLGMTGAAALAVTFAMPDAATSGQEDPPCSETAANCQVSDISASALALGSNGTTIFSSDNFSPSSSGSLTHFCFWAIYNSNVPGTDNIVISFYNDSQTTSLTPGYPVAPAQAIYGTADLMVTRADTGLDFAGLDVYEYSVTYTGGSPFNVTSGNCYWIEISNAVDPEDAWFILCADNPANLGDLRAMQRGDTVEWGYNSAVVGNDLAICINGGLNLPPASCAIPEVCMTAVNDCGMESGSAGCADAECCTVVCIQEPTCCLAPWDSVCTDIAINSALCATAPYDCDAGGPANDCATNPTELSVPSGQVAFDLTNANTDGAFINATCNDGDSPTTFDVWYLIEAPADGNITVDTCATDVATDLVVNIHEVGDGNYDPQDVLDELNWLQCDDDGCCPASFGCPSVTNFFVTGGTHYLIRVGTWNQSDPGPGFIEITFDSSVALWNSGPTSAVLFNGNAVNLGYTSGNLSATSPELWSAQPFSLPAVPAGDSSWRITQINAGGFTPANNNTETVNFIVWERSGIGEAAGPPVLGDEVATGFVAWEPEVGSTFVIQTDFNLAPGDYWLTVYGDGDTQPSTIAWFANAQTGPDGIPNLGSDINVPAGEAFFWRSSCMTITCDPNPQGFAANNPATVEPQEGQDPDLIFTAVFAIIGEPRSDQPGDCPQDCVTSATFQPPPDGIVDGADLAVLLGDWGPCPGCCSDNVTSATFQPPPDGIVDGADLAVLLGAWGEPGCQE